MTSTTSVPRREPTERELAVIKDMCAELDGRFGADGGDPRVNHPPRPCFALGSLVCGGASVLALRWVRQLPPWVREQTTVWARAASPAGARNLFGLNIAYTQPVDPTHWLLSTTPTDENFRPPAGRTTILLHTADEQYTRGLYAGLVGADVMAVSASALRAHEAWLAENHHRVLGVLPPVYPGLGPPVHRGPGVPIHAVFVGRPSAAKGFHLLPRLLKLMPDLVVTVYVGGDQGYGGTSEETAAVHRTMQVAERMRVGGRLIVGGYCDALGDYRPMYAGQDVLVLLSLSESQPLVIGEALSCGVPVVATAVGGTAEVLADGAAGVLVPSSDTAGWDLSLVVEAIRTAVQRPAGACQDAVQHLCGAAWDRAYRPLLLRQLGADVPQAPDARVTVVIKTPAKPDLGWLDACVASIAGQTYRQARVVLACEDEQARRDLAFRYELPAQPPGLRRVWTEYAVEVPYGLRLCRGYLEQTVRVMDDLQVPAMLSPAIMLDEDAEAETSEHRDWAPGDGVVSWRMSVVHGLASEAEVRLSLNTLNSLVAGRRIA